MAASFTGFSVCCAFFVLFILNNESLASSSSSSPHDPRVSCPDGVYEHGLYNCCRCAAGQRVKEHCTGTSETKCEPCEKETYNLEPTGEEKCQPCKSCTHPNANLEEVESCTPAKDAKCRCKKDYFCSSDTGNCKLCHSCKVCVSGSIKHDCTATSDTVCNDEDTSKTAIISVVVLALVCVVGGVVGVVIKKIQSKKKGIGDQEQQNESAMEEEEMQELKVPVVDLEPLVPEIAEQLGWIVMKDVATRSKISKNAVYDCERNHPGQSQEQTRELMQIWIEDAGKNGSVKLIQILRNLGQNATADKVLDILMREE